MPAIGSPRTLARSPRLPLVLFAAYIGLSLAFSRVFPFSRIDMFASPFRRNTTLVARAGGVPVELTEFVQFSEDPEALESPSIRRRVEQEGVMPNASGLHPLDGIYAYIRYYSEARGEVPSAAHAFVEVETGLGRNRSPFEALWKYARWLRARPTTEANPTELQLVMETISYDGASGILRRETLPLWHGRARRLH